ncbi:LAETG motif-containing sortase-dependent surface protein [Streptomyces sp. MNU103]|uniref:LAETG motif-containing sortase-dependent surface protein n=1 Tax=Streptomyces sp. MNU103 TaxID=2560024 RepID=UPI00307B947B
MIELTDIRDQTRAPHTEALFDSCRDRAARRTHRGLHEASPRPGRSGRDGSDSPGRPPRGPGRPRDRPVLRHDPVHGDGYRPVRPDDRPRRDGVRGVRHRRAGRTAGAGHRRVRHRRGRERHRRRRRRLRLVLPSSSPSPSASTSASPSPNPSASTPAEEDPELCLDEDGESTAELSDALRSGLSGLPETIVAGSGWTTFTFDVSNRGDEEIKNIRPLIGVAAVGWEDVRDYSGQITVQAYDKATGRWNTLAGAAGEGATFAAFSLGAGQSVSYQLRLSVSGKVPDALGLTGGFAEYSDTEGCWIADDPNGWIYFFDILAAGSDAGDPDDAKPQTGGVKELDRVSEVKVTGSLAETGSNSALPVIGLVGGVAVVAGAGALFVVRRRKAGAEA